MIDRIRERIRRRGHEAVDVQLDIGAVFLHRTFPSLPDAGEREQAAVLVTIDGEPVPLRWLAGIGPLAA